MPFDPDPTNPGFGYSDDGGVMSYGPAPTMSAAPVASVMTPQAQQLFDNVHSVNGSSPAAAIPKPAQDLLSILSSTTTNSTQRGIAPAVLNPVLAQNTATADKLAGTVERVGNERSTREQKTAEDAAAFSGSQRVSFANEAAQHAKDADIARQAEVALRAQNDPDVKPGQFMASLSTGQTIGTAILAAINGAFKSLAVQGQGPVTNDVVGILDKRIDQDIEAQKAQIESGRLRRGNLISFYQNQGMKAEAAEQAARAQMWVYCDRFMQDQAKIAGSAEARENAAIEGEKIRAMADNHNDELKLSLGADRKATSTSTVSAPTPKAGAGVDPKSVLELTALMEKQGLPKEKRDAVLRAAGFLGKDEASGATEAEQKRTDEAGKSNHEQGQAADAKRAIDMHAQENGLVRDTATGKWIVGPGVLPPALGEGMLGGATPAHDAAEAAVEAYGRFRSGGAIQHEERAAFREQMGIGTRTRAQLASKLNAAEATIDAQLAPAERAKTGAAPEAWR